MHGQLKRKTGPATRAGAQGFQTSTQFRRGQCAAMQTEPVAVLPRRETVLENAVQIFWGNAHAVISNAHGNITIAAADSHLNLLVIPM